MKITQLSITVRIYVHLTLAYAAMNNFITTKTSLDMKFTELKV